MSRYLTNKLIRRGTIQEWPKPFPRRAYAVLASVSRGYSPLLGRFPRVTHPFATKVTGASPGPSFDLHVLSMPPAFVLSQDQTLKLNFPPQKGAGKPRAVLCTNFRFNEKMHKSDESSARQRHSKTAACASLLILSTMSKSKNGTPPPAKKPPAVNSRERGSTRRQIGCQILKRRESHYIPTGRGKQQNPRFRGQNSAPKKRCFWGPGSGLECRLVTRKRTLFGACTDSRRSAHSQELNWSCFLWTHGFNMMSCSLMVSKRSPL